MQEYGFCNRAVKEEEEGQEKIMERLKKEKELLNVAIAILSFSVMPILAATLFFYH